MSLPLVFAIGLLGQFAPEEEARQFDRRARDEPEVTVKAGGRVGTADAMRFSPQGDFLFGVGDDKVVHVWPHSAAGLDTSPRPNDVLRWRSWRDQLGGIKAIAVSPDGKRVAIGGYGLRISTVAILDRETGATIALTWPKVREGDHYDAVMAVAFDAEGKRVGFGTADGTLWLWNPEKLPTPDRDRTWTAPTRVGRFTPLPDSDFNFPRNVRFADANTLVGVAQSGQVIACKVNPPPTDDPEALTPAATELFDTSAGLGDDVRYKLDKAAWSGNGQQLVVTTEVNLVIVRAANDKQPQKLRLPVDHFARSLAVHPKTGKIAIGVAAVHPAVPGKPRFYAERDDAIWVYDDPKGAPRKYPHAGRAEALAFHPTEDRLAIAGGDADEVTLLDVTRDEWWVRASPVIDHVLRRFQRAFALTEKPLAGACGVGRRMHAIRLSAGGDVFAVQTGRDAESTNPNDRGRGEWVRFNIPRFTTTPDEAGEWLGPVATADEWRIAPSHRSRFVWFAVKGKTGYRLVLDKDTDQAPTCYTFVPTPPGQPPRVLVGHYYGCSLFVLDPARAKKNQEFQRSKLYIGHGAEVNAIAPDKTGTWFVTAGADQTVAAWSLADWESQPALGAKFAVKDGHIVVTAVDVGSPAWEAGLSEGDRIDRLGVGGKYTYDRRAKEPPLGTIPDALDALAQPRSGSELAFWWRAAGQPGYRVSPTRLKQRPLWKWFPAFDEHDRVTDSVMWMWHGSYYFTRSTHGDRLIGWHVNHPEVAGTPQYHVLERYKHIFLRPDVMTKLIDTRSVAQALKAGVGDKPERRSFREVEAETVVLAVEQAVVQRAGVAVTVAVNPSGNNPDLIPHRVELWVNDYRHRVWATKGRDKFHVEVVIPAAAFRAGDNQITVLALNPARGRAEDSMVVVNRAPPEPPTLLGLLGGIDDYSAHRKAVGGARDTFDDLTKTGADVESLRKRLLEYCGNSKHFPAGDVVVLLNANATRAGLTAALDKLKATPVKPNDLLVVFLAGHGDLLDAKGQPYPPPMGLAARGRPLDGGQFVFCCPDYQPAEARTTALSGEELFDALAEVNCRKLVLIDACHSGGATQTNMLRRFIPNGQGPLVIAACAQNEQSFENDTLGHGAFTYAVLEALGEKFRAADRDSNGALTPAELYTYLADRVPTLVRDFEPGKTQTPICFPHPSALPKIALVTESKPGKPRR